MTWISFNDPYQWPDDMQPVLLYAPHYEQRVYVGRLLPKDSQYGYEFAVDGRPITIDAFTHWAYLPEAPR